MTASDTLTELLAHWQDGHDAHVRILLLVYADLRRIAGGLFVHERPDHTLQATGLVNEAYIRLMDGGPFNNRAHFFGAAANAMRQTLVDYARRRNTVKRGSSLVRVELEESSAPQSDEWWQILDIDDALSRLECIHPRQSELVKLRYFAGLSLREAADVLGIGLSSRLGAESASPPTAMGVMRDGLSPFLLRGGFLEDATAQMMNFARWSPPTKYPSISYCWICGGEIVLEKCRTDGYMQE